MKKNHFIASALLLATVSILLLNSCLKDTGTMQYYAYTPVYKTSTQVRAEIKSDAPQPITNPAKMCVLGNTIFLVETEKGIHIIDNTNPSSPVNKAFINIPGNEDIAVQGNILYANCYTDLMAIDVSNPDNVVLKNYAAGIFPERRYIYGYYVDSNKVITDWVRKNVKINLQLSQGQGIWSNGNYISTVYYTYAMSLSSSQAAASNTTAVGGSMARMAIQNDHLYAVSTQSLYSISIAKPLDPTYLSSKNLHLGIGSAETIYPFQDKLFIGSTSGMYIFSVTDADNPQLITTFTHATACDPVITDGTNAYITLRSGRSCGGIQNELDIVNVQDVTHPTFLKKYNLTRPQGLSKDGNTLIVCDDGLKVYDATDPSNLLLKKSINLSEPYDVICINGLAIVSAKDGLYQFDYSDLANVKLLSKLNINQ
jgi:hypothetical protein